MPTTTKDQSSNKEQTSKNQEKGKQGFASMPKEKVREIAAEGGRHSHGGSSSTHKK
ncbi:KGG domain-containing protein [Candidatus Odyssella acanthamoebae]|uniref:KGG domain-containing protein n=1 Tax=Candidatus Odyssella acanthamoebae TaxID=91604 RepID=UPI0009FEFA49|nr:KGG domain-containing protein [Candidatus Paracaedibacter acanthamoebae]